MKLRSRVKVVLRPTEAVRKRYKFGVCQRKMGFVLSRIHRPISLCDCHVKEHLNHCWSAAYVSYHEV